MLKERYVLTLLVISRPIVISHFLARPDILRHSKTDALVPRLPFDLGQRPMVRRVYQGQKD